MTGHSKELSKAELKSFMALCPTELGPAARVEWERVVPTLSALKLIKHLDLAVVALYCNAYAGWISATKAVQDFGAVIKTPKGYPVQSPYVAIAKSPSLGHDEMCG